MLRRLICWLRGHDVLEGCFCHDNGEDHHWRYCQRCGRRENELVDLDARTSWKWVDWEQP